MKATEREIERLKSIRGGVSPEDSSYFYLETNLRIQKEAVSVDFQKLFKQNDSSQDIIVQDGDEIVVPSLKSSVYVFGQVASPGHIPFAEKADVDYYIRKVGGFTDRARSGDMRIVKARTRQWLSPSETTIEEGDFVWVPKALERPFSYYLNIVGQVASIISVAASIIILASQAR